MWQLWWAGKSQQITGYVEFVVLHLIVTYADGRSLGARFDKVQVKESVLSVGNMIRDDGAGNWWGAPFDRRPLRDFPSDNCLPFYTPDDTCVSNTVPPVEEQLDLYNGTIKYRGYPWRIGNVSYDSVHIRSIELWITCLHCVDETFPVP